MSKLVIKKIEAGSVIGNAETEYRVSDGHPDGAFVYVSEGSFGWLTEGQLRSMIETIRR